MKLYGKEEVEATVVPKQAAAQIVSFTKEDEERVRENVTANYVKTALDNPDVTFYFYLPPYSIYYWQDLLKTGQLEAQLKAEELAVSLMTDAPNIHVFGYADRIDITGNLDNYMDILHYGDWINEEIMNMIYKGEGELTKGNYRAYFQRVRELYSKSE